jgi:hypothetical protein
VRAATVLLISYSVFFIVLAGVDTLFLLLANTILELLSFVIALGTGGFLAFYAARALQTQRPGARVKAIVILAVLCAIALAVVVSWCRGVYDSAMFTGFESQHALSPQEEASLRLQGVKDVVHYLLFATPIIVALFAFPIWLLHLPEARSFLHTEPPPVLSGPLSPPPTMTTDQSKMNQQASPPHAEEDAS